MLDSLVRVSRRVLKVPKAVASLTSIFAFECIMSQSEDNAVPKKQAKPEIRRTGPYPEMLLELARRRARTHLLRLNTNWYTRVIYRRAAGRAFAAVCR